MSPIKSKVNYFYSQREYATRTLIKKMSAWKRRNPFISAFCQLKISIYVVFSNIIYRLLSLFSKTLSLNVSPLQPDRAVNPSHLMHESGAFPSMCLSVGTQMPMEKHNIYLAAVRFAQCGQYTVNVAYIRSFWSYKLLSCVLTQTRLRGRELTCRSLKRFTERWSIPSLS